MNNISFQGRTNISFNDKTYEEIIAKLPRANFTNLNLSLGKTTKIHNAKTIIYDPNEAATPAVLLINEKDGIFFHNAQDKIRKILEKIEILKSNAKDKLTAWIIGGYNNNTTYKSVDTLAEVLCDRPDIDTSILAAQKSACPNLTFYHTTKKLDMTIGMHPNTVGQDLEDIFNIIELNNTNIS